jgi:hypothetical protein
VEPVWTEQFRIGEIRRWHSEDDVYLAWMADSNHLLIAYRSWVPDHPEILSLTNLKPRSVMQTPTKN